jgi:uncharacterized repeat protein (TIGR03803 family)
MFRILNICGACTLGCGVALAVLAPLDAADAASFKVLYDFNGGSDGSNPLAGLIADGSGNLYGTTQTGGDTGCESFGCGTVFKLAKDGTEKVLYAFKGGNDGIFPLAGLVADAAGNLYGTTQVGGGTACGGAGCGTVFKLAKNGTEKPLHVFTDGSDGAAPHSGVIVDATGNLFGTAQYGGGAGCSTYGCGIVFKVGRDGKEKVLYAFKGGSDGAYPVAALMADGRGNLFGTTGQGGGTGCSGNGCGTVFKLAKDGTETVLYAFKGGSDGAYPAGGVIADAKGNLLGTTDFGGSANLGTVYKLAKDGSESVLHAFTGGSTGDGGEPAATLTADAAGNLYGTTIIGGSIDNCGTGPYGCGTVFKLAKDGTEKELHVFTGQTDGAHPYGSLFLANGYLYSTTEAGGALSGCSGYGCGNVFRLKE